MRLTGLIPSVIAGFVLLMLTANSLWADWGPNLLLVRSYGPLFPNVHALSIAAPTILAWVLVFRKKSLAMGVIIGFSVAAIHDFILVGAELALVGRQWELGLYYAVIEAAWLAIAVRYASKGERKLMLLAAVGFSCVLALGIALGDVGTTAPGVLGTPPSFDLKNNLMEILGWVIGPFLWLVPKGGKL